VYFSVPEKDSHTIDGTFLRRPRTANVSAAALPRQSLHALPSVYVQPSKVLIGLTVLVLFVVVIAVVMAIHVGAIAPRLLEFLVPFARLSAVLAVPLDSISQLIFSLLDTSFTL